MIVIQQLIAREILDSRGIPTVEVELTLSNGLITVASVPSGASTGEHEACELRDGNWQRYLGKGVLKAVVNVNDVIAPTLLNQSPLDQASIDQQLIVLDGTLNKSHLGANAILAVSLAVAKAAAICRQLPLFASLNVGTAQAMSIPAPMMNIINGGAHANNGLNFQEFMIMPLGFDDFPRALQAGVEIFQALKKILNTRGFSTSVGDEGGFAPALASHRAALDLILEAINSAGYSAGTQIFLSLDLASSEFYQEGLYHLSCENLHLDAAALVDYLSALVEDYPILSIEDAMAENDWAGWQLLTLRLGHKVQLVGDDLFVTNTRLLQRGIDQHIANAILIKPNQIGTLTETMAAIQCAKRAGYQTIVSHRSGETEDTTIADLAVSLAADQIKTGSLCRTDRMAKYNQLLRISADKAYTLAYAGPRILQCLANMKVT